MKYIKVIKVNRGAITDEKLKIVQGDLTAIIPKMYNHGPRSSLSDAVIQRLQIIHYEGLYYDLICNKNYDLI